jgi:hypothetical protein
MTEPFPEDDIEVLTPEELRADWQRLLAKLASVTAEAAPTSKREERHHEAGAMNARWTERKQQFVEVAARALWPLLRTECRPRPPLSVSAAVPASLYCAEHESWMIGERCKKFESAPPFSKQERLRQHVALWLGHIEAANGCELDVIVQAAAAADAALCVLCGLPPQARRHDQSDDEDTLNPHAFTGRSSRFDLAAFAAALVLESLGVASTSALNGADMFEQQFVPSWFDNHARFTLGATGDCECGDGHSASVHTRAGCAVVGCSCRELSTAHVAFILPPLELVEAA